MDFIVRENMNATFLVIMDRRSESLLIIYGSQTGQGESIADQIYSEALQMGLEPRLHCMNETDQVESH